MEMRFSDDFLKALEFSRDEAVRTGWHNISPDHIMLGILRLEDDAVFDLLGCAGVQASDFKACLDDAVFVEEAVAWDERDSVVLSDGARSFLEHACLEARRCGSAVVGPLHFILALCRVNGPYSHDYLEDHGASLRTLVEASGLRWEDYGLAPSSVISTGPSSVISTAPSSVISTGAQRSGEISSQPDSSPQPDAPSIPDAALMAEAIERRIREGYSTGIIPVS